MLRVTVSLGIAATTALPLGEIIYNESGEDFLFFLRSARAALATYPGSGDRTESSRQNPGSLLGTDEILT
jgi:hypothetical protein